MFPQYVAIIYRKSSFGLSWLTLFLGNVMTVSIFSNGFLLRFELLRTCQTVDFGTCAPHLIPLFQLAINWCAYTPVFLLYLIYFDERENEKSHRDVDDHQHFFWKTLNKWPCVQTIKSMDVRKLAFHFLALYLGYVVLLAFLISFLLKSFGGCTPTTTNLAFTLGIFSSIINICLWTPQIIRTYQIKSVGSLSITTIFLIAPGNMLFAYVMAFQTHENFTTWLPSFVAGCQQYILLALLIYYECKERKRTKKKSATAPLLPDSQSINEAPEK